MAPSAYFEFFWSNDERVHDLAKSLQLAKLEAGKDNGKIEQNGKGHYTPHLQAPAAMSGIEDGLLVKARKCF